MVSGFFSGINDKTLEALSESGVYPDEDGNILIQRTVYTDGKSQIKINGRTVTLSVVRSVSQYLITIHGQNDTSDIANVEKQLEIVDAYSSNLEVLNEYREVYAELEKIRRQISDVMGKAAERERLSEMLEYQIKDIDSYALYDGEEEALIDKKLKIKNSEKISKNAGFVFKALKGSEKGSVSFLLDKSISALLQISDVIPDFAAYAETLRDQLYRVDDIAEEVYATIADMEEDPTEALNKIESRLDKISKLKRKYGYTISDILAFREKAHKELEMISDFDGTLKELKEKESAVFEKACKLADELHESRVNSALQIEKIVKDTLEFLDMPKIVFFACIKEDYKCGIKNLNKNGYDKLEFFISANRGADAQPLSKIASGGEMARIMLALKIAIADKEKISTLIFDEIDAGVSGKTARKIGIKMLALSEHTQLLCVTHSAQIASLADEHFLIKKTDVDSETVTNVSVLDNEGRITELSRILGGIDVTAAQRMAAEDMLREKSAYSRCGQID